MIRLLLLVLVVVAVMVAYPWVAVAAGVVLVAAVTVAVSHACRRRRRRTVPAARLPRRPVSLDRRVALRRAYRELNDIERGAGLPPTPPSL